MAETTESSETVGATAAGKAWVKQAAPPVIPLARPQAFPALPPTANSETPTPVYRHPSGAQQLGALRLWGNKPTTGATQSTATPGIATAPKSPGVDSGPGVLRISQHGGTSDGSYMLGNPTNADINISSRAANDWAFEPALPANTNPSCLISDSCNSNADGGGADPSLYARWLKNERGGTSSDARYKAYDAGVASGALSSDATVHDVKNYMQQQAGPLNLNKVVMMPPGYESANSRATDFITEGGSFESPYMHGSFPAPAQEEIRQNNAARGQGTTNAPHEYRLLPGGDPTSQGSWTDTGNYTDARQSTIPLVGAFGEAREMGRHFGLGKELGGGGLGSYLDKVCAINNNADATYAQKVRSNLARPAGSALQFGREVGGIGHDVVAPAAREAQRTEAVNKRVMGPGYLPPYRSSEKAGSVTADIDVIASAAGKAWANLVPNDQRNGVVEMLDEYKNKATQKYVREKVAISPKLITKALSSAAQWTASGQIDPTRFRQFVNHTNKWLPGAIQRQRAPAISQVTAFNDPHIERAITQQRALPKTIQDAYAKTYAQVGIPQQHAPLKLRDYANLIRGRAVERSATQPLLPAVKSHPLAKLLGVDRNNAYYAYNTHRIGGELLPKTPVLFHELGHALDLSGRWRPMVRARQQLMAESAAWRRGTQLFDNWRNALPDTTNVPTTKQILQTRHAPLNTYRLRHVQDLVKSFNRAYRHGQPELQLRDIGAHGRVFSQTFGAMNNALKYTQQQQPVMTYLRGIPSEVGNNMRSMFGSALKWGLPTALGGEVLRRVFGSGQ